MTIIISFVLLFTGMVTSSTVPSNLQITGGNSAAVGQFPFQVEILKNTEKIEDTFLCCGSLLSNEWVLTAAHCVFLAISVTVYLGDIRFKKGTEYTIKMESGNIIRHEKFSPFTLLNDIALIKIPFTKYSASINSINLPYSDEEYSFENAKVIAAGWGATSKVIKPAETLQYIQLTVMKNEKCKEFETNLDVTQLCVATKKSKSPCVGDCGGPLIYNTPEDTIQIGIHSFDINNNCEKGYPVGYVRVAYYLQWMKHITGIERKRKHTLVSESYIDKWYKKLLKLQSAMKVIFKF